MGDKMARRFKTKKRINYSKLIIVIVIFLLIFFFYHSLSKKSVIKTNKKLLNYLTKSYDKYSYKEVKQDSAIITVFNSIKDSINSPSKLLIKDLLYENKKKEEVVQTVSDNNNTPLVYIYNTHQKEAYAAFYVEDYNINPDVLLMSHIMQEKLNNEGITTIVEENNITEYLKDNDMDYSDSYKASRVYLKDTINKYPNLKLIIDLHRDATSKDISTTFINDLGCARIMFVVGNDYDSYQKNLETTNTLNNKISNNYPSLTRGVLQKKGKGVNGVYNQDLGSNIILLELGSDKNNIDELTNTIDLIVPIIKEYINEKA